MPRHSTQKSTSLGRESAPPTSITDSKKFQCPHCPASYIQERGLSRHDREKHKSRLKCLVHDCDHEWISSREYGYREHLRNKHKLEVDQIDEIFGRPARSRRPNLKDRLVDPPPHTSNSPPPVECEWQSLAESQQRSLMGPPLAEGRDANHTSPPVIPSAHYPQPGDAEPEVTTTNPDDSNELEHHATSHGSSSYVSNEEMGLLAGNFRFYGAFRFPISEYYETGTTVTTETASPPWASCLVGIDATDANSWPGLV